MRILVSSSTEVCLSLVDQFKQMGHRVDLADNCDSMEGISYGMVVYDATPCQEDRFGPRYDHSHLLDFSDVVVMAYRLTTAHPSALHVLISSDESLYRDGGYYGRNRKIVEEIYGLCRRYLIVRCPEIIGHGPNYLMDCLIEGRPFPYTLDTTLQFVSVKSVVGLICASAFKVDFPTVLVAAGTGCVFVHELGMMADVTVNVSDRATKISRDCDSSIVERMEGLKTSKDYAWEYLERCSKPNVS